MLILTRWTDQSIFIGDNIQIKVLGTRGNRVRIGIEAPKDCVILREECLERFKNQHKAQCAEVATFIDKVM